MFYGYTLLTQGLLTDDSRLERLMHHPLLVIHLMLTAYSGLCCRTVFAHMAPKSAHFSYHSRFFFLSQTNGTSVQKLVRAGVGSTGKVISRPGICDVKAFIADYPFVC